MLIFIQIWIFPVELLFIAINSCLISLSIIGLSRIPFRPLSKAFFTKGEKVFDLGQKLYNIIA